MLVKKSYTLNEDDIMEALILAAAKDDFDNVDGKGVAEVRLMKNFGGYVAYVDVETKDPNPEVDVYDLLHETTQDFWKSFSAQVNQSLRKVPEEHRDDLLMRLGDMANVYSRDEDA